MQQGNEVIQLKMRQGNEQCVMFGANPIQHITEYLSLYFQAQCVKPDGCESDTVKIDFRSPVYYLYQHHWEPY